MTILFCQPTLERTGSERSLLDVLEGLRETTDNRFMLLAGRDGPMAGEFARVPATLVMTDAPKLSRRWKSFPRYVRSYAGVYITTRRLKRSAAVSLVYVNTSMFPQALVAAWLCRIPVVVHVHEVATTYPLVYYRAMTWLAARLARRILCVSDYVRLQSGVGSRPAFLRKSVVVHNASSFSVGPMARLPVEPFRILAVIPVTRRKGIEDLVLCAEALAVRMGPGRFRVDVVGPIADPELHARLLLRLARFASTFSFTFHGESSDVGPFYRDAHVLVHPSHSEAFPRVPLEAASFSLPVVATAAGGTPETMVDGVTGFLVPVGDAAAMAARIEDLLTDPALYGGMAEAAYRHSQRHFTRDVMIARLRESLAPLGV